MAVVEQPIADGSGHDRIGEHRPPFGHAPVRGDQHRARLVAPTDQLEEEVRGVGFQRQVAQLVDDQQLGLG